jgi:hypothetical protein
MRRVRLLTFLPGWDSLLHSHQDRYVVDLECYNSFDLFALYLYIQMKPKLKSSSSTTQQDNAVTLNTFCGRAKRE